MVPSAVPVDGRVRWFFGGALITALALTACSGSGNEADTGARVAGSSAEYAAAYEESSIRNGHVGAEGYTDEQDACMSRVTKDIPVSDAGSPSYAESPRRAQEALAELIDECLSDDNLLQYFMVDMTQQGMSVSMAECLAPEFLKLAREFGWKNLFLDRDAEVADAVDERRQSCGATSGTAILENGVRAVDIERTNPSEFASTVESKWVDLGYTESPPGFDVQTLICLDAVSLQYPGINDPAANEAVIDAMYACMPIAQVQHAVSVAVVASGSVGSWQPKVANCVGRFLGQRIALSSYSQAWVGATDNDKRHNFAIFRDCESNPDRVSYDSRGLE